VNPQAENTDELIKALQSAAGDDLHSRATNLYVSALPDDLRAIVHCGAILRWFDQAVLEAVLKSKELGEAGWLFSAEAIDTAYEQLQRLTFVEPYPGRGYTFHELTRASIRGVLWTKDRDFYLAVSRAALNYFSRKFEEQTQACEAGGIAKDQIDFGLLVEMLYHQVLTQNFEELGELWDDMDSLYDNGHLGLYHDMIIALDDHVEGGRLDKRVSALTSLWKAQEAFANWEFDVLQTYALPLADSDARAVPAKVSAVALRLLGLDAERRAQYKSAQQFYKRSLGPWESLENPAGLIQALIDLGRVSLACEDHGSCRRYINDALQRWIAANRIPVSSDSGTVTVPPLKCDVPTMWVRREVEVTQEEEESEKVSGDSGVLPDERSRKPDERLLLYFVPVDDDSGDALADQAGAMWPVQVDQAIPQIWLLAAELAEEEEDYDRAAACARLSGQICADIGNMSGALSAVSVLERMGAQQLDHELVQFTRDYRETLTKTAAGGGDRPTLLYGLISQANSLAERLQLDDSREMWNEALSLATELRSDNSKATCLTGLAKIEWSGGNIARARELFDTAMNIYRGLKNQEGFASTVVIRAELEASQREFSDAKRHAQQALATYTDVGSVLGQYEALQAMANIDRQEGEYERAFTAYRKALDLVRRHKRTSLTAVVLSRIADLELSLGKKMEAEVNYDKAINISRKSRRYFLESQILLDKANILSDQAEYAEANKILDRVLEANPENEAAWAQKGWCLQQLGPDKADEAIEACKRAIELAPNDIYSHRTLADSLELAGDVKEAEAKLRWTVETFEVNPKAFESSALSWCYYKLGQFERAARLFNERIAVSSETASDYFDLALVHASVGRLAQAVNAYERAILALNGRFPPRTRLGLLFVARLDLDNLLARVPSLRNTSEIAQMRDLLAQAEAAAVI